MSRPRPMLARPGPAADALALVLERVRLHAALRAAWLRHLWQRDGAAAVPGAVTHAEADLLLADADAPEAEAAWIAAASALREPARRLAEVEATLAAETASRLAQLRDTFALAPREVDWLHACLALALDPALGRLYAYLQDDAGCPGATEALVGRLFRHGRSSTMGPAGDLRRWGLLVERAPGYACDPALLAWLDGQDALLAELAAIASAVPARPRLAYWPVEEAAGFVERQLSLDRRLERQRLHIAGMPGSGRRSFAAAVAARFGLEALAVDADAIAEEDWPASFTRVQRCAWLDRRAPVWTGGAAVRRTWPRGLPWFPLQFTTGDAREPPLPVADMVDRSFELPTPGVEERLALWHGCLPASASWPPDLLNRLAAQHRGGVGQVAAAARQQVATPEEAEALLREAARRDLRDLAEQLECPFAWDDLVLPEALRENLADLLHEAEDRVTFWERPEARRLFPQGRGLLALFTGPPGTGKTMAAQVLAARLGVDLFRIDLSAVVSKYVGETSRNLEQVLRRAACHDVVLLFDEADALFGRRTEVKDAHDRYANTDVNHLLQAVESYRGVALLASNRRADIDPAFSRRLRYVLDFPAPDAAQRAEIWRRVVRGLAGEARAASLEAGLADMAASLDLTGAQIKFAVLNGVFAARRQGCPLGLVHLLRGIERELLKEGRALGERLCERWSHAG